MSRQPASDPAGAVDLIIPARNEQDNIPPLLAALPREWLRHVVVVDNGSTDATADAATAGGAVVVHEPRRGYGAACLAGLEWIEHRSRPPMVVAFLDADLADDPGRLPAVCNPVLHGEADLVIGARHRLAEPGALTRTQQFGNRLSCFLIRLLTGQRFGDLGPMRAVGYTALLAMAMSDRTWGWTVEMQFKAGAMGLRSIEIDVPYRCRRAGKSKISGTWIGSARAGARILATIGRLWLARTWRGPPVSAHAGGSTAGSSSSATSLRPANPASTSCQATTRSSPRSQQR